MDWSPGARVARLKRLFSCVSEHGRPICNPCQPPDTVARRNLHKSIGDLAREGIAQKDDQGRRLDLHSLRVTFGTNLVLGGRICRIAQELMRHRYAGRTNVALSMIVDALARHHCFGPV